MGFLKRARDWKKWYSKAKAFASGGTFSAYRKKRYPKGYFCNKGNIVKVSFSGPVAQGKMFFYGLKIAHELFPKNTPVANAVLGNKKRSGFEIHMNEVPITNLHSQIMFLQEKLIRGGLKKEDKQRLQIMLDKNWELFNSSAVEKVLTPLETEMQNFGIDPSLEHPLNVSLKNPQNPILFEPEIYNVDLLIKKVSASNLSSAKKKKVLSFVEQWNKARDELIKFNAKHLVPF
jgi:hypothetical protein